MKKSILITGVSTGIGFCMAQVFLERGYTVFGSVRKVQDAQQLQEIGKERFVPLVFDVCDEKAIAAAVEVVRGYLPTGGLTGLINNAAIAVGGPLLEQPMHEIRKHFEVNIFGVLHVVRAFAPFLGAQKNYQHQPGRIVNIGSVSGEIAAPFVGAYAGTKFALEGMSDSLRRELLLYGIDVVVIRPGHVATPIWDKGGNTEQSYDNSDYLEPLTRFQSHFVKEGKNGENPVRLANQIADVFEKSNPKTRYTFVKGWFKNWFVPRRILSDRTLDRLIGKGTRLLKKK